MADEGPDDTTARRRDQAKSPRVRWSFARGVRWEEVGCRAAVPANVRCSAASNDGWWMDGTVAGEAQAKLEIVEASSVEAAWGRRMEGWWPRGGGQVWIGCLRPYEINRGRGKRCQEEVKLIIKNWDRTARTTQQLARH